MDRRSCFACVALPPPCATSSNRSRCTWKGASHSRIPRTVVPLRVCVEAGRGRCIRLPKRSRCVLASTSPSDPHERHTTIGLSYGHWPVIRPLACHTVIGLSYGHWPTGSTLSEELGANEKSEIPTRSLLATGTCLPPMELCPLCRPIGGQDTSTVTGSRRNE